MWLLYLCQMRYKKCQIKVDVCHVFQYFSILLNKERSIDHITVYCHILIPFILFRPYSAPITPSSTPCPHPHSPTLPPPTLSSPPRMNLHYSTPHDSTLHFNCLHCLALSTPHFHTSDRVPCTIMLKSLRTLAVEHPTFPEPLNPRYWTFHI